MCGLHWLPMIAGAAAAVTVASRLDAQMAGGSRPVMLVMPIAPGGGVDTIGCI
jgi:hypothetical protein